MIYAGKLQLYKSGNSVTDNDFDGNRNSSIVDEERIEK